MLIELPKNNNVCKINHQNTKIQPKALSHFLRSVKQCFSGIDFCRNKICSFYDNTLNKGFHSIDEKTGKAAKNIIRPMTSEAKKMQLMARLKLGKNIASVCKIAVTALRFILTLSSIAFPILAIINTVLSAAYIALNVIIAAVLYIKCGHDKHLLTILVGSLTSALSFALPLPFLSIPITLICSGLNSLSFGSYFQKITMSRKNLKQEIAKEKQIELDQKYIGDSALLDKKLMYAYDYTGLTPEQSQIGD